MRLTPEEKEFIQIQESKYSIRQIRELFNEEFGRKPSTRTIHKWRIMKYGYQRISKETKLDFDNAKSELSLRNNNKETRLLIKQLTRRVERLESGVEILVEYNYDTEELYKKANIRLNYEYE